MSFVRFSLVLTMFLVLTSQAFVFLTFAEVSEYEATSALTNAEGAIVSAYQEALKAEEAGANVSGLLIQLNEAGGYLAHARTAYRLRSFDEATGFANLSRDIAEEVQNAAVELKDSAVSESLHRMLFTMIASVVGMSLIALGSLWVWHLLKKRYGQYRSWFIIGSFALILAVAYPTSALYIRLPSGSEMFSELWLLGPGHKAEDYPFNVRVNETYSVYVGVGNHLGYSAYYRVYVKFRNQTQPLPMASNATPSTLSELYEFDFFVRDGAAWETLLKLRILDIERFNDFMILNRVSINELPFDVGGLSVWDSVRNGFYYQLFFELWLYNMTSQSFQYNNRFVGLWLNMTA